jgi:hypothetical protein
VSSNWSPPANGGLTSADGRCTTDAVAAGLPGTYKALLATSTASAISRFNTAAGTPPWARPDNTLVTNTANELAFALSYVLASPNSNAANDTWYGQSTIWTGAPDLINPGTALTTCNDWNDPAGTARVGVAGRSALADWRAASSGFPCTTGGLRLVCMQD